MPEQQPGAPGTVPVTDHRPVPRGVLPRNLQTWLMAGLAVGIVAIILLVGQPDPPRGPATASVTPQAPNPDRVREYQDRLRALEAQALRDVQAADLSAMGVPPMFYEEPQAPPREDPIAAERRRREYESLFASNVVLSRRSEADRPGSTPSLAGSPRSFEDPAGPSIDEIADAVVRATTRAGGTAPVLGAAPPSSSAGLAPSPATAAGSPASATPGHTGPISATGPLHRVLEGTMIDAVLTNRLDGSAVAPVNLLVTNPVYSHSGRHVLIPAGARILGETRPVQTLGETRLAVGLHRLLMPDGRTYSLDRFLGLNQIGDAGLRDQVNRHYWSTFGGAGAVGLITGLAQWLGTAGFSRGDGNRTVIIAGGATDATAQASMQVMNQFLNRLPTVTIREGHRVKVYLTGDLELPASELPASSGGF